MRADWWQAADRVGYGRKFFYVYLLLDENGTVFYVGKGSGNRMRSHVMHAVSLTADCRSGRHAVIRSILAQGGIVRGVRCFFTLDDADAMREEKAAIAFYNTPGLTNNGAVKGYSYDCVETWRAERKADIAARRHRRESAEHAESARKEREIALALRLVNRLDRRLAHATRHYAEAGRRKYRLGGRR